MNQLILSHLYLKKYRTEQSTFARIVLLNSSDGDAHRTHGEK